jgi:ankyrin repeat protein
MDVLDQRNYTLPNLAAFNNETKIFESLVDYERAFNSQGAIKAWLSHQNTDSFTPMHFAAYRGNVKILQLLKSFDVDFNFKNDQGRNCISIAA